jgi:Transposase, Mutator family
MLGELVKVVLERALESELTTHLGYGKHDPAGNGSGNSRNGSSALPSPRRAIRPQQAGPDTGARGGVAGDERREVFG